jgi:polysaccharide export outer membrane protein
MKSRLSILLALVLASVLSACAWSPEKYEATNPEVFHERDRSEKVVFADRTGLAEFESEADPVYLLGEGDRLALSVWGRTEFESKPVIGPDGRISMPLVGTLRMAQLSRDEAAESIARALRKYYKAPVVSLSVEQYVSNRITVLGRVQNPGVLNFDKVPTILEVLARAGALPVIDKQATLTRCAIFRGRDKVIWVNLQLLLSRSDPSYNIRLKPNDLVYIPDSNDTSVYVMGAVPRPGAYRLTPDMALLDALAQAGGPNEDAQPQEIAVYRPSRKAVLRAPMSSLMTADQSVNFALEEGDIVYVPKSTLAEAGYVMRQLLPGLSVISFGISTAASVSALKTLNATKMP